MMLNGPLQHGSDVTATAHFLTGFKKALGEGDLYPRWTDRTNRDLGAPSFVMYPPLTFYGASLCAWIAGSITGGLKLYLFVVAGLTALSCYALARELIGPGLPATVAAAAYVLLPYHVLDVYQRFALSETTAFIYFPLIVLFARRTMDRGRGWHMAGLALSYAALVATHLVSGFFFSLFLGPWLMWEARRRWGALLPVTVALACGLALSAPALLPAVLEKGAVNIAWQTQMPNGDVRINFIFKDDVLPGLGFKDPVKPPVLRSAHTQLLLAGVGLVIALASRRRGDPRWRQDAVIMAAGCGLAYLMQLELSLPVWLAVPELATIQFPWRLQAVMVLTGSLLAGFASAAVTGPGSLRGGAKTLALTALGLCLLLNLALSARIAYLKPFTFDEKAANDLTTATWVEPASTPVQFRDYRTFRSTQVDMPRAVFLTGQGTATVSRWLSSRRVLDIESDSGGSVALRSFYFPGWTARLDGAPLAVRPHPPLAVVAFDVPQGRHTVELWLEPSPLRRWSWAVCVAGLAATVLMGGPWLKPRAGVASPPRAAHAAARRR
ncbi:MAG: 6-pyruvoyl-tetrahydropterin synthase-related protein [Candidatus Polarisedimenticolia bacterium]